MNTDKEMAELFLNLYNGCIKFQREKERTNPRSKPIDCDKYYEQFEKFSIKYIDSKKDKN